MLLELETEPHPASLFLDQRQRSLLRDDVLKTAFRFPRLFNRPLYRSFEQMVVNSPTDFLTNRTNAHLRMILCVQFFLQKKIEAALNNEAIPSKQLFLKLSRGPSRICVALVFSSSYAFQKDQLLNCLDQHLPGISELPKSFYIWHSAEFPYYFCYFEVDKTRGKEFSTGQLKIIEKTLKEQMVATTPLTPAVFWPYNKEESSRQIQLLIREMQNKNDLPHISIHFQEQTVSSLEFLIHLVRPKTAEPLALEKLPESLYFFRYSKHQLNYPFPIEIQAFSIKMQSQLFALRDTINLLYARRYLAKHLEALIGPFRDFNGGLFEKQQDHFEMMRLHLSSKIPFFDLFAEKVFYAIHPFERWFSLSLDEVEDLFRIFSDLIQDQKSYALKSTTSGLFTILKTENRVDFLRCSQKQSETKELLPCAQLTIGNFHYECFSGRVENEIEALLQAPAGDEKILRLIFQEGSPPSLNPHYSSSDMRSRLLNKLLFEGLTRLNQEGKAELSGASQYEVSENGLAYTFRIRKANWSNGEKVTAFDYVDSWKWALQDLVSHPELLFCIKNARKFREKKCPIDRIGARVIDPETLEIELEEADPHFLKKLAQPFFYPLFGAHREPKWFNGPYMIEEVKKTGLKLGKNPYFWKTQETPFEEIEVQWVNEIGGIYRLFREGKADWIGDPLTILSIDQIRELESEGRLLKKSVARRFSLHFNTEHPILASVLIRRALSLSIDRSHICREIFPHSIPCATANRSRDAAVFYFENGLRELGMSRETLPILTFSYSDQTRRDQLAAYLQTAWIETLGIKVELKKQNWNSFRSQLEKRNFEICGTIQDTLNEDSLSYLERFEGASSWNFAQWVHPTYRELLIGAKNDLTKQQELKDKARELLSENVPFAPLFDYVHLYAHHPQFECSTIDEEGCIDFSQMRALIK